MFNPAEVSKKIKDEFVDYITTTFTFADQKLQQDFVKELNQMVSKGPIIDIKDIFKSGKSINDLIKEEILSKGFLDLENDKPANYKRSIPVSRPLYKHQEKAIDVITIRKLNAVITTGTGSGKTECFLLPVLNEILSEIEEENGEITSGVRAILIYPMNALANDQMKRLRKILMYYDKITFGVYNGDTKWEYKDALASYINLHQFEDCEELKTPLSNELICREQMQKTPPHILCTNYAMLEQMLLRPENDKIFSNSNFKFVVLDEAHVYTGATGIETSLLLRRLRARINSKNNVQYILTSATLGEKGKSENDILTFAENLCGEKFDIDSIVFGERENKNIIPEPIYDNTNIFSELCKEKSLQDEEIVRIIFENNKIPYNDKESIESNLYHVCLFSKLYKKIRSLSNGPIEISELTSKIKGYTENQIVEFIHICTMASHNGESLIDAKYHFFVRALEGAFINLTTNQLFLDRKNFVFQNGNSIKIFEIALCKKCGEIALVGKIDKDRNTLEFASNYEDKDIKFLSIINTDDTHEEVDDLEVDELDEEILDTEEEIISNKKEKEFNYYNLCPICGAIVPEDEGRTRCECKYKNIRLLEIENNDNKCIKCQSGFYNRFYLGNEAATAVLATTLFEELPLYDVQEYDGDEIITRPGGKQFLAFSDSRSDAAFFASYMDKSYKEFLRRRGVIQLINKYKTDFIEEPLPIDEFAEKLAKLFTTNKTFRDSLSYYDINPRQLAKRSLRNAWIAVLNELLGAKKSSSLSTLGFIKFEYMGNDDRTVKFMSSLYPQTEPIIMKNLLDELAMTFAYFGAIEFNEEVLETDDIKYIYYSNKPKYMVKQKSKETTKYYGSWMARNREGKEDSYFSNYRQKLVARSLNITDKEANKFLDLYFEKVLKAHRNYHIVKGNGDFYCMPPQNYLVRVNGDPNLNWYVCNYCNRITNINIDGRCPNLKCNGKLAVIDINSKYSNNHYVSLYNKKDLFPLIIKEHTAQLSREEGLAYQQDFEKNRINALSCSTTFEMGVDVGELETVFLRNVPPSSANYAQRAGRAGRSKNSAAYALTYAKLSSHDFNYFRDPIQMINGKIQPPIFKIDNKKIVLRHIFAVAFSYFFKEYPEYFNNNKAMYFLENHGYEKFSELMSHHSQELTLLMINSFGEDLNKQFGIENYTWLEELTGKNGVLTALIEDYKKTVSEFEDLIKSYSVDAMKKLSDKERTDAARKQSKALQRLDTFKNKKIIDFFARGNILPKYGFPVDTVELEIANVDNVGKSKELQLTRDLKMAISEYAPGEKIVANNKLYTSRYIKHSIINGQYKYHITSVCQCGGCGTWNYSESGKVDDKKCIACENSLPQNQWTEAIEPKAGFLTDGNVEEVPMEKPDKLYKNDDTYIGNKKFISAFQYQCGTRKIILKSTENDQILVTSKNIFYVCPYCGFSYGILDTIKNKQGKKDKKVAQAIKVGSKIIETETFHTNSYGHQCSCNRLNKRYLNHVYNTDVLILEFSESTLNKDQMLSVMYALLNAISTELDIDRKDINATLKYNNATKGYDIVLYDAVAGGAGHVKRLADNSGNNLYRIFHSASNKLSSCKCDSSCYNCLRGYENQRVHDVLDRNLALEFINNYNQKFTYLGEIKSENKDEDIKLTLVKGTGQPLNNQSLQDALSYLIDEDEEETNDIKIIKDLIKTVKNKPFDAPDFYYCSIRDDKGKVYKVDLFWELQSVILLLSDKKEIYDRIKYSKKFNVFCLNNDFDIDDFLKALRR